MKGIFLDLSPSNAQRTFLQIVRTVSYERKLLYSINESFIEEIPCRCPSNSKVCAVLHKTTSSFQSSDNHLMHIDVPRFPDMGGCCL